ncbi:Pac1 protein [Saccharomycopsis crataegensis]|uniref:Nuclear distribution protein PAC1 n=1 Tax=Saccharomycopsis crataegensis TaxID=43959 RepID=A0AAV5QUL0_9ASCO|nr:Pac1 protein [Saccharomycopsis crataegensis]
MSALTSRQKIELHKAISQYLKPNLEPELYKEINLRLELTEDDLKSSSDNNLLAKKWSTVIRLQKKILDLESQVSNLNELLDASSNGTGIKSSNGSLIHTKINWLPSRASQVLKAQKSAINSLDIHPFLPELVAALNDGSFVVWDLLNPLQPSKLINGHTKAINGICYGKKPLKLSQQDSSSGSILVATCSSDLYIKIWDSTNNFELKRTLSGHTHTISSVKFKNNDPGQLFSSSRDGSVILWDVTNGWRLRSFVGHSDWVRSLDLTPTDEFLISCANDQSARLSHGDSGIGLSIMIGHTHVVEDCKFAPRTAWKYLDMLATAKSYSNDPTVLEQYNALDFKYCATASRDETIKIWLLPLPIIRPHRPPAPSSNPSAVCIIELKGHSSWVRSLQFHPGGKYLFSSSDDKSIKIWDLSAIEKLGVAKCIRTLNGGHEGFVNCIKFATPIQYDQPTDEGDKITDEKEREKKKLNELDKSIRTIFASGGTDNNICMWV